MSVISSSGFSPIIQTSKSQSLLLNNCSYYAPSFGCLLTWHLLRPSLTMFLKFALQKSLPLPFLCSIVLHIFVVVVQLLSHVQLFVTPWIAICQASPSFTISWSLIKFMSIESVMLSISSSAAPFYCLQSFPVRPHQGLFPTSWLFTSCGQSIGASAIDCQNIYLFIIYFMPYTSFH